MILILDTNVFMEDWHFNSPPYKALLDYVKKTDSKFWMPRVVLEELKGKFVQELETRLSNHTKLEREIYRLVDSIKEPAAIFDIEKEVEKYIKSIFKKLKMTKKSIMDYPEGALDVLVNKAVHRIKPFTLKGEEFRDALLWENVMDAVVDCSHSEYVVFISNDLSAFGNITQKGKENELHPHLESELLQKISDDLVLHEDFQNQKDFLDKNFGFFKKINDFIEKYNPSVASITKSWLKKQIPVDEIHQQFPKFIAEDDNFVKNINKLLRRRRLGVFAAAALTHVTTNIYGYYLYTSSDATSTVFFNLSGNIDVVYSTESDLVFKSFSADTSDSDFSIDSEQYESSSIEVEVTISCTITIDNEGQVSNLNLYSVGIVR
jgi:hypothetical protein